jgi:hypothetical protein
MKAMKIKEWIGMFVAIIALSGALGGVGLWAADQRYVTQDSMTIKDIRDLDREITYIEIKKQTGEATASEMIYVETLKQQKRALEKELGK